MRPTNAQYGDRVLALVIRGELAHVAASGDLLTEQIIVVLVGALVVSRGGALCHLRALRVGEVMRARRG